MIRAYLAVGAAIAVLALVLAVAVLGSDAGIGSGDPATAAPGTPDGPRSDLVVQNLTGTPPAPAVTAGGGGTAPEQLSPAGSGSTAAAFGGGGRGGGSAGAAAPVSSAPAPACSPSLLASVLGLITSALGGAGAC